MVQSAEHADGRYALMRDRSVLAALLLIAVALRLPAFFLSIINGDESTFILMGRDMLEGHLPYVHLWDNKPPLGFALFALFLLLGGSIPGVRFFGALYVGAAACGVYMAARKIFSQPVAIWLGLMSLVYACVVPGSQAVMMEHLSTLPIALMACVLAATRLDLRAAAWLGLWVGLAGLIRTNLFLLLPGTYVIFFLDPVTLREWAKRCVIVTAAALLPLALAMLIYAACGDLDTFLLAFFVAPVTFVDNLAGAGARHKDYLLLVQNCLNVFGRNILSREFLLWGLLIAGAVIGLRSTSGRQTIAARLIVLSIFIIISIVCTGGRYDYYLIQFFPIASLLCGFAVERLLAWREMPVWIGLAAALAFPLSGSINGLNSTGARLLKSESLMDDESYLLADYLRAHGATGKYFFACDKHILYYLLGSPVATFIVHPTNLYVDSIAHLIEGPGHTSQGNFKEVMARSPAYIVVHDEGSDCEKKLGFKARHDYALATIIGTSQVYKRIKPAAKIPGAKP